MCKDLFILNKVLLGKQIWKQLQKLANERDRLQKKVLFINWARM